MTHSRYKCGKWSKATKILWIIVCWLVVDLPLLKIWKWMESHKIPWFQTTNQKNIVKPLFSANFSWFHRWFNIVTAHWALRVSRWKFFRPGCRKHRRSRRHLLRSNHGNVMGMSSIGLSILVTSYSKYYPLVIQHSHGKDGRFIGGLPIKNGDFPWLC